MPRLPRNWTRWLVLAIVLFALELAYFDGDWILAVGQGWVDVLRSSNRKTCEICRVNGTCRNISANELKKGLTRSPRGVCGCAEKIRWLRFGRPSYVQSFCSDEATLLGLHQKVISFSLFSMEEVTWNLTKFAYYFDGVLANLQAMKTIYPGWHMRVYTNLKLMKETQLCSLVCSDRDLYFCHVLNLPVIEFADGVEGNVGWGSPRTWRFLPLGDPTVEKFAVRDLDSRLSQREKDAVDEWAKSEFPIHGMRDFEGHDAPIMGGMWGADNYKLGLEQGQKILWKILKEARKVPHLPRPKSKDWSDQAILARVVWEPFRKLVLTHDSYNCQRWLSDNTVPFPTQRRNRREFVGAQVQSDTLVSRCPHLCRPAHGWRWEYC